MGRNRLFRRLLFTNIAIIFITMVMLFILFYIMFQNYYFQEKERIMVEEGKQINTILNDYIIGDIDLDRLSQNLNVVDRFINASIWVVSTDGRIYIQSRNFEKNWTGVKLSQDDIKNILHGETIVRRGYFGGRFTQPVLTVGLPLVLNGKIQGAIFMHAPIVEMQKTLMDIFLIMIIAISASILVAFILISYTSKRISDPLKEMSLATKKMAKGDFSTKINVIDDDEIGDLSKSFNVMSSELGRIDSARKEFVANVSHELRSPLSTIQGYIDGVVDGTIPQDKANFYLGIAQKETRRMARLISELLDITKMESGEFPLTISEFDVNELIRLTLIKMESRINDKKLMVKVDFDSEKNIVEADKDRIEQVLTNLIDNAIKFSDIEGYIHVLTEKAKDKLYIKIQNKGKIIPDDEIPHIWDRFYKADKSRSGSNGVGLGLYIVKNIINQHNEDIWVKSNKEDGTTFTFTLKLKKIKS
ncbi:HAMP domain-containing sensor histidine kinase [Thermoanaerobacterium sp. RBIITD]|uniref:sensor histidine kinase n=1 Tax=Thermoanaerobacterium sp. RBIITD TaxID=1550240 RepID=UPI000BB75C13|nr:HAMP domain-containing sensor histidine kinase [Thermoanaerobacterium sp. RBIITD]SNX53931.1 HAMP domain-containing protein [Thermoanaerobacterium sp. RBIITD]